MNSKEKLFQTISAGSSPIYEILINDVGSIILRSVEKDPSKSITILSCSVPTAVATALLAAEEVH